MVRCVVCGEDKEVDYCFDCEQVRRRAIKQHKNKLKDKPLEPISFNHKNDFRQF